MQSNERPESPRNRAMRANTHQLVEMVVEASESSEDEWEVAELVEERIRVDGVSPRELALPDRLGPAESEARTRPRAA